MNPESILPADYFFGLGFDAGFERGFGVGGLGFLPVFGSTLPVSLRFLAIVLLLGFFAG